MQPTQDKPKFRHSIQVRPEDIDALGHVNNVVYLRWVQEVATSHWMQAAPEELQNRYLWVVLRHEIDYVKPAFLIDDIIGYTWVGEHHGAKFERFVSIYRAETEELLAEAKTMWCLLDAKTIRPKRIEQDVLSIL